MAHLIHSDARTAVGITHCFIFCLCIHRIHLLAMQFCSSGLWCATRAAACVENSRCSWSGTELKLENLYVRGDVVVVVLLIDDKGREYGESRGGVPSQCRDSAFWRTWCLRGTGEMMSDSELFAHQVHSGKPL